MPKNIEAPRSKLRGIFDCKEFCQLYSLANPAAIEGFRIDDRLQVSACPPSAPPSGEPGGRSLFSSESESVEDEQVMERSKVNASPAPR